MEVIYGEKIKHIPSEVNELSFPEATFIKIDNRKYLKRLNGEIKIFAPMAKTIILMCTDITKLIIDAPLVILLNCAGNKLTNIQLNTPQLKVLSCIGNKLTNLNLNMPDLETVLCSCNDLNNINISSEKLKVLICFKNPLQKLELNTKTLKILRFTPEMTTAVGVNFENMRIKKTEYDDRLVLEGESIQFNDNLKNQDHTKEFKEKCVEPFNYRVVFLERRITPNF